MTHTNIRARRRRRFVVVDQSAVEDVRLSWAACGLLAYLLSRPDDWRVLVKDLRRRGDLGRDSIYTLLRELRTVVYVRYERIRDAEERLRGGTDYVSEQPDTPDPARPDMALPERAIPGPAVPCTLPNTDSDLARTTTTTTNYTYRDGVELAVWLPAALRGPALEKVARSDPETAQVVLDERANVLALGTIRSSPLGYLHALVSRAQAGTFEPKYAEFIADMRHPPLITV